MLNSKLFVFCFVSVCNLLAFADYYRIVNLNPAEKYQPSHAEVKAYYQFDDQVLEVSAKKHVVDDKLISSELTLLTLFHFEDNVTKKFNTILKSGKRFIIDQKINKKDKLYLKIHNIKSQKLNKTQVIVNAHPVLTEQKDFGSLTDELVSLVDGAEWLEQVNKLAAFNRYARGNDIAEAANYLVNYWQGLSNVQVERQAFTRSGVTSENIIATLPGSEDPEHYVIIGAHYDSISERPFESAPGAEDNASGTAALLVLAKALSLIPPKLTVKLIAFSGEEQGLLGSKSYVSELVARNEKEKIKAVIIMDMIGYSRDDDLDCLLESDHPHDDLLQVLQNSAAQYTDLRILKTFDYWGSDHVPFLTQGIPTTLIIENDYSSYPAYHRSNDLPDHLNVSMGWQTIKMIAGGLGYYSY